MEEYDIPNYYAIIPANVRYDSDLTANAKLLYGEITALCNKKGYCWSSNAYFADLYKASKFTVSKWVSGLIKKGYIKSVIIYEEDGKTIKERRIYLTVAETDPYSKNSQDSIDENAKTLSKKTATGFCEKCQEALAENAKENNTVNNTINNTSNNINKEKTKKFSRPSVEEVRAFIEENNYHVDPEQFVDYYESVGWKVGKDKPMKDWRSAVRNWERRNNGSNTKYTPKANGVDTF